MRYRVFGRHTGLKVSELVLGTGLLGYDADPDDARNVLRAFADAGGNFIDTADNYQYGAAESMVGQFLKADRNDFVIASKYGRGAVAGSSLGTVGGNRKVMVQAVEESLKRLGTDRIDVYFVHLDDEVTPIAEIARGLDDLVRAGKVIYGGFSNIPAWRVATACTLAEIHGWTPISAIQVEYSLLQRTADREILPMADGFGLGVMAYSSLAGGLLTGTYREGALHPPRRQEADIGKHMPLITAFGKIAEEIGTNLGQVAIAWVKSKGAFPIIGPRTLAELNDNLGAAALGLSEAHIQRLDEISAIPAGYPYELNHSLPQRQIASANLWERIDFPNRTIV